MTKFKNILSLNATEAQEFLLQDNQYHTFELPEYFNFEEVLQFVKKNIGDRKYEDCIEKGVSLDTIENVCLLTSTLFNPRIPTLFRNQPVMIF